MKKMILLLFLIVPVFASSASSVSLRKGNTLWFNGEITFESSEKLLGFLRTKGSRLIINSNGGDAKLSLQIASEIAKNKVTVIVDKYCLSSCANYLFISAFKKSLSRNAILGFHGGFSNDNILPESVEGTFIQQEMKKIHSLLDQDRQHFKSLGFDRNFFKISTDLTKPDEPRESYVVTNKNEKILLSSKEKMLQLVDDLQKKKVEIDVEIISSGISKNKFYFPSKQTLKRYGVTRIYAYSYPKNQESMDKLARSIDETLELIGDFEVSIESK